MGMWLSCSFLRWTLVGWGVVDVVVDKEMKLVGVMAFVYDSLSHDMLLDVALDLENLHIHLFVHSFHQTPEIYSKYVHILRVYTQN